MQMLARIQNVAYTVQPFSFGNHHSHFLVGSKTDFLHCIIIVKLY